ncbi:hypothetical protein BZB76_4900 [Actinomadura pelletieri DSM 43383]|uniref:Homeodomain-like domain-containing protein n=1 Tax=Actinomadura pelletieri DSM 43383 TaxID=1120940 RepID=A0A495QJ56_9ACTN|nr:helix-turn-helix domain-containing protein [Actinomadura pelletieri]RKS72086.1 hypothetical protein BZB76_4900 [Actinomadura pelletieri DSM 43383]
MPDEVRDKLKPKAIELRRRGWTYREIAGSLDISLSTCSLWLRDISAPPRKGYSQERVAAMWKSRWEPVHTAREQERLKTKLTACHQIGDLDDRDILMLGALAYWCEGGKDKPYKRSEFVSFINSDAALIVLFLRFLSVVGVPAEHIQFRLHIHETADLAAATAYWAELVDTPSDRFQTPIIKRHRPKTNRRNLAQAYRGCLLITVRQSADLYRRIEGWAHAAMLGPEAAEARLVTRSDETIRKIVNKRCPSAE